MLNDKQKEKERLKKQRIKFRESLRKEKTKHKKQFSRTALVKEADRVFSLYIRGRDAWKPCCTCWTAWTEQAQCGHFQSRRHLHTRWSNTNAHSQCYRCNMLLSGEQYKHWKFIDAKYGNSQADFITIFANWTAKIEDSEILETIQKYYRKCFELGIECKPKKQFLTN